MNKAIYTECLICRTPLLLAGPTTFPECHLCKVCGDNQNDSDYLARHIRIRTGNGLSVSLEVKVLYLEKVLGKHINDPGVIKEIIDTIFPYVPVKAHVNSIPNCVIAS
jgi:hypothetical protein